MGSPVVDAHRLLVIGRISSGLAHDLNGAMSVIINAAEVMRRHATNDPQLDAILDSARHAIEVCRRLSALSTLGARAEMSFDPNPGIERIARFLGWVLAPVEVQAHLDPKVQSIFVDPFELERMIVTQAADARDGMPKGGRLTLRTLLVDDVVVVELVSPGRLDRLRFPAG